jgi:transposase-like protein
MTDSESGGRDTMKPVKEPLGKVRRQYDATFKQEAVQNWLTSGKSAEVVARELGLSSGRLFAWRRILAPASARGGRAEAGARAGSATDLQSQLDVALRENRHLREQRDILKKTLGILSEPSLNALHGSRR